MQDFPDSGRARPWRAAWNSPILPLTATALIWPGHAVVGRLAGLAFNLGDLMVLIACLLYAGYTLGLRERPRVSPLGLLAGMALAAFASSLPLFVGEVAAGDFIRPTGAGLLLLLYAALGPAFVAQLFYMRGVELIGPGRAGAFVNLVPAFGALMAVGLLGEPFAAYHVVALALVVGGVASRASSAEAFAAVAASNSASSSGVIARPSSSASISSVSLAAAQ